MRLSIYFGALFLMMTGLLINSYGQGTVKKQATEVEKREQRNFYRQTLQVDSAKADQVLEAQNTYKDSLKAVLADTTLNDGAKRSKIGLLMEVKNEKLRKLLNTAQQQKLIPSTERKSGVDGIPSKDSQLNK